MLAAATVGAMAMLVSPPPMEMRQMATITAPRPAVGIRLASEKIFPTTTVMADL